MSTRVLALDRLADTSPLRYAVEIEVAHALFMLYGGIVVPVAVASETGHSGAPEILRRWVEDNRDAIEVGTVRVPNDPSLALPDPGELEAITLAQQTPGSLLIIDDRDGRKQARRRGLRITGPPGVIRDAALRGYLDFDVTLRKLRLTDFRLSVEVEDLVRRQYHERAG